MNDDTLTDLQHRLALIERMVQDSRRRFDASAWLFLLWGGGHVCALLWQWYLPHPQWAWPVLMGSCALLAGAIALQRRRQRHVEHAISHAIGAIWLAFGAGLLVVFSCDRVHPLESFFLLYGLAQIASGIALRYHLQVAVGLCWLLLAGAALVTSSAAVEQYGFLAMAVLGEILFGVYGMARERAARALAP